MRWYIFKCFIGEGHGMVTRFVQGRDSDHARERLARHWPAGDWYGGKETEADYVDRFAGLRAIPVDPRERLAEASLPE